MILNYLFVQKKKMLYRITECRDVDTEVEIRRIRIDDTI